MMCTLSHLLLLVLPPTRPPAHRRAWLTLSLIRPTFLFLSPHLLGVCLSLCLCSPLFIRCLFPSPFLCPLRCSVSLFSPSVLISVLPAIQCLLSVESVRFNSSSSLFLSPSICCSHLRLYTLLICLISLCLYHPLTLTATQRWLCKPCDHFLPIHLGGLTALP